MGPRMAWSRSSPDRISCVKEKQYTASETKKQLISGLFLQTHKIFLSQKSKILHKLTGRRFASSLRLVSEHCSSGKKWWQCYKMVSFSRFWGTRSKFVKQIFPIKIYIYILKSILPSTPAANIQISPVWNFGEGKDERPDMLDVVNVTMLLTATDESTMTNSGQ